jgi:signal transduction histidine kinase
MADMAEPADANAGVTASYGRAVRYLLRIPLFYKLIIANGVITLGAVIAGSGIVASAMRRNPGGGVTSDIWVVIAAAALAGVLANAFVVRLALLPLRDLEQAANEVRSGSYRARATLGAISDESTERVITAFNTMLDSVSVYQRRLKEIAIRAIDAGEAERMRLSGELHDGVAQSLAAALIQMRIASQNASPETAVQLTAIGVQITGAINELRALAQSLRPPALDMIGITAALESYARKVSESTSIRVTAKLDNIDKLLGKEEGLTLYRLVQEAVQNVVQHAHTNAVLVEVYQSEGTIEVRVTDRGRGFNVMKAMTDGALGLHGMHERALYVGGRVDIRSIPGDGTTVCITLPITSSKNG